MLQHNLAITSHAIDRSESNEISLNSYLSIEDCPSKQMGE